MIMLEELILEAWERAGRHPNREFVHSIIYGDAPVVVTLAKEVKRLKETLEDMCYQFASWSDSKGGHCTGGLSALEDAFEILGWTDPHPAPKSCCQEKGCKKQATCGTPTADGYKRLCIEHFKDVKDG